MNISIRSAAEIAHAERPVLSRAQGIYVWDSKGRRYLDAISGAFCAQLGYTRPDIVRAMTDAASRLPHARPSAFESDESAAYQSELLDAAGEPYSRVVLTSSGSEAVDVALKIAIRYQHATGHPDRQSIRYLTGHYHGATLGALGVTGVRARRAPYAALIGSGLGAAVGPNGSPGLGESAASGARPPAAMILETIPAVGLGAIVPPLGYLARIRDHCDAAGALWIADEVLTGFGRLGALFAWQRIAERRAPNMSKPNGHAHPDLIIFGKGAGAGFAPLAGVLIIDRVAQVLNGEGFSHHQTYGGNPIACAVGRRVLRVLAEERIYGRVRAAEPWLEDALRELVNLRAVRRVRGIGYLWGIELAEDRRTGHPFPRERHVAEQVADACRERGVLVYAGAGASDGERGDFILIAPPLVTQRGDFKTIASAIREAISSVLG